MAGKNKEHRTEEELFPMSKLNDLLSQLFAKGYDGKTAPAGTTLADEMVDHVSGGVPCNPGDEGCRCITQHSRWVRAC
jgi:hypothetical protein